MMIVFLVSSIVERPRAIPALQKRQKSSLDLAHDGREPFQRNPET
jgi:hypothetical protein